MQEIRAKQSVTESGHTFRKMWCYNSMLSVLIPFNYEHRRTTMKAVLEFASGANWIIKNRRSACVIA